VAHLYNEDIK